MIQTHLSTDTWVMATWDEYLQTIESSDLEKAKGYYWNDRMRIEMSPVGNDHASDHVIVTVAVSLFAALKGIPINGKDTCTYRKAGRYEVQPDVSYYIGDAANAVPWGTTLIGLDQYPPPTLVIEVANTSLADDRGAKRLLYEEVGVNEYWIVDVQGVSITAFTIFDRGSRRIDRSVVLPGLEIALLEEALHQTRQTDQGQVVSWLLAQFQAIGNG
jgi:Uma2 family endonuclease